jgi:hypothetical protein
MSLAIFLESFTILMVLGCLMCAIFLYKYVPSIGFGLFIAATGWALFIRIIHWQGAYLKDLELQSVVGTMLVVPYHVLYFIALIGMVLAIRKVKQGGGKK